MTRNEAELPRDVTLQGASNVRDLGGYSGAGGRRVRFGKIFRAAALSRLTEADVVALAATGLRTVVDLRGEREREQAPSALPGVTVHALSIEPTLGGSLREIAATREATGEDVMVLMRAAYTAYAMDWSHRYRALFDLLLGDEGPLLFHCTAGKDRTGFGAALILTALGVDEATVHLDYMATSRLWRGNSELAAALPAGVAAVLLSVNSEWLHGAFGAIRERHGTVERYLGERIGLDEGRLAALRGRLLE